MVTLPRVVVAAPASGQGKTSVTTGLLRALRTRGLAVSPHKVGPDYIDPGYHAVAAGRPGRNLDPWLVGEERIIDLFVHGATTPTTADIAIIEGVMGLFDGASGRGDFASTAHVAKLLQAPVLLVIDASGVARSIAALLHGFATYDPNVGLAGVILNKVGSAWHAELLREAIEPIGIPVLGSIQRQDDLAVPSRHLGLIPAAERSRAAEQAVDALAAVIARGVDLDGIVRIARSAPSLRPEARWSPAATTQDYAAAPRPRIAVAGGAAFTFGYAEHSELLTGAGAQVVTFDPLRDEGLPPDTDALVIGGGFPEVHAAELASNEPLRSDVQSLARSGAPIIAECAGLLYLGRTLDGHSMCGVLDIVATMTPNLTLGYREAVAPGDSAVALAGTRVRGHEFHRTKAVSRPAAAPAWKWRHRGQYVDDGILAGGVHASYLHVHWAGLPEAPARLVSAALAARLSRSAQHD